jgi:hypothetical protein
MYQTPQHKPKTPQEILAEIDGKKKTASNPTAKEQNSPLVPLRQQRTWTENASEGPEVVPVDFKADNTPFEYTEGMSVYDILNRGKKHKESLEQDQGRMQRVAKVAALGDFFKALGGLAGGGHANTQQYQPSPYLTRAFSEIDRLRSDRTRADMYYDELARKTRQEDYNTQLRSFLQNKDRTDRYNYQTAQANANARNRANVETYRAQGQKITETTENPKRWEGEQALRAKQIGIQEQNAETNRIRADKYKSPTTKKEEEAAKGNEVILTVNNDKSKTTSSITRAQAEKMIKRAQIDLKDANILTREDKELRDALYKADMDKAHLAKAAYLLRKYKPESFDAYFKTDNAQPAQQLIVPTQQTTTQPKGSFLPPKKRNLLD